jgi:hypothetical protein
MNDCADYTRVDWQSTLKISKKSKHRLPGTWWDVVSGELKIAIEQMSVLTNRAACG